MKVLLDTNVLIRLFQTIHPSSPLAVAAVQQLNRNHFELCLVPQNLYEIWVVATRPTAQNGFGMSTSDTVALQKQCLSQFRLLRDERGIFDRWKKIVSDHQVQGKNAHDARLVAAMQKHLVPNLLTFNGPDFKRFAGIAVFDPSDILNGNLPATP